MTAIATQTSLVLPEPFPDIPVLWTDPVTGLKVPKSVPANIQYRIEILTKAQKDEGFRNAMFTAASQSLLFYVNTFVWTNRIFKIGPDGRVHQCSMAEAHVPFVTWTIQDKHLLEIETAIGGTVSTGDGYDLLTDKSRDMGATWDHLAVIDHQWRFKADRSFLLLSRKQDCVDSTGKKGLGSPADPGTLFGKLDYISKWLPNWMMPMHTRTTIHLVNLSNRSRIDGESANASAGSSDRRTAIMLDEMAKMVEGEAIKRSTRDVTACRLVNSTPNGAGTAFSKWRMDGTIKVFVLPWWEHPEKGFGRYAKVNKATGIAKTRSPWYDIEETIRTPREMAIEVDMDHVASGDTYFSAEVILKHINLFATKPPVSTGYQVAFRPDVALARMPEIIQRGSLEAILARYTANGPWTFYQHLIDGRPDQTKDYVLGFDISKGQGASNSVISVGCIQERRKVAEWACGVIAPHDFAIIAVASAIWFGGSQRGHRPFMIWEANGDPGIEFGKMIVRVLKYPFYYLDRHTVAKIGVVQAKKYGWHSSPEKKFDLLNEYRRALDHGTFINPSVKALREAETYVYFPGGQIGPASLQFENASARKTHGDRVIADALCHKGMQESGIRVNRVIEPPKNSIGGRFTEWQRECEASKRQRTWDVR